MLMNDLKCIILEFVDCATAFIFQNRLGHPSGRDGKNVVVEIYPSSTKLAKAKFKDILNLLLEKEIKKRSRKHRHL